MATNIANLKAYLSDAQDYDLAAHDAQYHPHGFREGDVCKLREQASKSDDADRILGRIDSNKQFNGVLSKAFTDYLRKFNTELFDGDDWKGRLDRVFPSWRGYVNDGAEGISEQGSAIINAMTPREFEDYISSCMRYGLDNAIDLDEAIDVASEKIVSDYGDDAMKAQSEASRERMYEEI